MNSERDLIRAAGFVIRRDPLQYIVYTELKPTAAGKEVLRPIGYIGLGCRTPVAIVERVITEFLFNKTPAIELMDVRGIKGEERKRLDAVNAGRVRAQWDSEHDLQNEKGAAATARRVGLAFARAIGRND